MVILKLQKWKVYRNWLWESETKLWAFDRKCKIKSRLFPATLLSLGIFKQQMLHSDLLHTIESFWKFRWVNHVLLSRYWKSQNVLGVRTSDLMKKKDSEPKSRRPVRTRIITWNSRDPIDGLTKNHTISEGCCRHLQCGWTREISKRTLACD